MTEFIQSGRHHWTVELTSLDQIEIGTVVARTFEPTKGSYVSTYWKVTSIKAPHASRGVLAVYGSRVRKSDHQIIKRGGLNRTEDDVLVYQIGDALNLTSLNYTLSIVGS